MFAAASKRVLPGFTLSLGTSLLFVCLILLLPLSALVMQLAQMTWSQYWDVVTNPQVVAAYKVTLLSAFVASIFNGVFGLLMAWILTRYRFPGRTLLDALMAGVALSFTRSLGEFGAVIFIAGNIAWKTEVTSLMIFIRLQEFDYPAASAIASVILAASLLLLYTINTLQSRFGRRVVGH